MGRKRTDSKEKNTGKSLHVCLAESRKHLKSRTDKKCNRLQKHKFNILMLNSIKRFPRSFVTMLLC